ncbi:unnamed protein product [Amoebophrya sp. A25]|nr:unnamed protein product [Amoebophrya sp. A25]|eukprot:GSA25T00013574001.1
MSRLRYYIKSPEVIATHISSTFSLYVSSLHVQSLGFDCAQNLRVDKMTRIDRYPLLPSVWAAVYPNPKEETAYDTTKSCPKPPPAVSCSAADVSSIIAKMQNSASGPAYDASLCALKRCVWLQTKGEDAGWAALRQELGPRGTDFSTLSQKDPRVDKLSYGAPPNTISKFGLKAA